MRLLGIMSLLVLGPACSATNVEMLFDTDEDGLLDESVYGSDPSNPDSDGDGWLDGFEVSQERDPMDPDSHPYTGGWLIDADCNDEILGTGADIGDLAQDFVLRDQFDEEFRLHDFCNRSILLELSGFT